MEHLTFFVDPAWRRSQLQHSPLMYPFWGNSLTASQPFWRELFERRGFDTRYYSITDDPAVADVVFMPYSHSLVLAVAPNLLEVCLAEARQQGKNLLIDGLGDVEHSIDIPEAIVLRYGGYRFMKRENVIQIPPYADDLLELYRDGVLDVRSRGERAVIGFAGWAALTPFQEIKTFLKEIPIRLRALFDSRYYACRKGVFFRREAIRILRASSKVVSNFIIRPTFSANVQTMSGAPDQLRREFVENLLSSDYGLCIRGDANASMRLFETLALGRIPIILDTECIFPFLDEIEYKNFSLVIDFREIHKLPELIAAFHENLSPERFKEMQHNAREAYITYFRVDRVMRLIVKEIKTKLILPE